MASFHQSKFGFFGISFKTAFFPRQYSPTKLPPALSIQKASHRHFQAIRRFSNAGREYKPILYKILRDHSEYVRYFDIGEFWISPDGRLILARPLKSKSGKMASRETFLHYLYIHAGSFALIKLGKEPLHATVLEKDGKGIALIGDSGDGKSTLACFLVQRGFRLLTDDLLILEKKKKRFMALPGMPRIKLFPETARILLKKKSKSLPMNPQSRKSIFRIPAGKACHQPIPLARIYLLPSQQHKSWLKSVHFRNLKGRSAVMEIMNASYNQLADTGNRPRQLMDFATDLARRIPVRALNYPRGFRHFPRIEEIITADLREDNTPRKS